MKVTARALAAVFAQETLLLEQDLEKAIAHLPPDEAIEAKEAILALRKSRELLSFEQSRQMWRRIRDRTASD
jgi:hypothetical protein